MFGGIYIFYWVFSDIPGFVVGCFFISFRMLSVLITSNISSDAFFLYSIIPLGVCYTFWNCIRVLRCPVFSFSFFFFLIFSFRSFYWCHWLLCLLCPVCSWAHQKYFLFCYSFCLLPLLVFLRFSLISYHSSVLNDVYFFR